MTTIIGIATEEGVVLASDYCRTYQSGKKTINNKKIIIGKNNGFAFGCSGCLTTPIVNLKKLLHESEPMSVISKLKQGDLDIVRDANLESCIDNYHKHLETKNEVPFIIGTRLDITEKNAIITNPQLYHVYPMGNSGSYIYSVIGSGSTYARPFLDGEIDKNKLNLEIAIILAYRSLKEATNSDPNSEGMNIVVIKPDKIYDYFEHIQRSFKKLDSLIINRIIKDTE